MNSLQQHPSVFTRLAVLASTRLAVLARPCGLVLPAALLLLVPVQAQTALLTSPADFTGGEIVIDFEALSRGEALSTQYSAGGITFSMTDGGSPFAETVDATPRVFGPAGNNCLQNFDPFAPTSFPDLLLDFDSPTNRVGFEIKNNLNDDLLLELHCVCNGMVVDTQIFVTSFAWQFVGLQSASTFDQVLVDVTGSSIGAFRLDNLRYELDTATLVDMDVPEVTITAPADGTVLSSTAVTVNASVVDTTITEVTSSPVGISSTLPPGGGSVTGSLPLIEGPNIISVSALDLVGRTGGSAITVIRDTTPPAITLLSPNEGAVLASSPAALSVQIDDMTACTVAIGSTSVAVSPPSDVATAYVALTEGANIISVTATDEAGNSTTTELSLILDLSAPIVTIDSPLDLSCFGSGESPIAVTVTVNDLTSTAVDSTPGGVSGALPEGGGIVAGAIALAEGSNTIVLSATDATGRVGTDSIVVVLDTTGPDVAVQSPADGSPLRGLIDFDATALDVSPGSGVSSVEFFVDGSLAEALLTAPYETTIDTNALGDGQHVFEVVATDGKGNTSSASVLTLVDNTAPDVSILNPMAGDYLGDTVAFDALASDGGSGVSSITMLAGGVAPTVDGSESFAEPVASVVAYSLEDTTARLDGPIVMTAIVVDEAGNQASTSVEFTVDNTAPQKALIEPTDGSTVSGVIQITAEATDTNFAFLELLVDGQSLGTSSVSPFSVLFDTDTGIAGSLVVTVVATDLAGRVSTCSVTVHRENVSVAVNPRSLNLRSKGGARSVTVECEGPSVGLLLPIEGASLTLSVPGGSPVAASVGFSGDDSATDSDGDGIPELTLKFDRRKLIAAVNAGIAAGLIQRGELASVTLMSGALELGSDLIRIK